MPLKLGTEKIQKKREKLIYFQMIWCFYCYPHPFRARGNSFINFTTIFVRKLTEAVLQHPLLLLVPLLSPGVSPATLQHLTWLLFQAMQDFSVLSEPLSSMVPPPCGPEVQGRWLIAVDCIVSLATDWICIKFKLGINIRNTVKQSQTFDEYSSFQHFTVRHWNQGIY